MYDVYEVRKKFPMLNGKTMQGKPLVYLDNASTTFKPQCVIDRMNCYLTECTANSHRGDYDLAYIVDTEIDEARKSVAKLINCEPNEVVFTGGDTLSINHVSYGYGLKFLKPGDEILITEAEHAANVLPWYQVAKYTGAVVNFIPLTKEGLLTPENLRKVISNKTKIVAFASVGNVLGYIAPTKELIKIAHEYNAVVLVDAAQSVPHMKTDFKDLDADFLTFSSHKMCGPTGVGCLIGKYHLLDDMDCFLTGGGMNVSFDKCGNMEAHKPPVKFEAGTQPIAEIFGFKAAVDFILELGIDNIHKHEEELYEYLKEKLEGVTGVKWHNSLAKSSIYSFNIEGVFSQDEATLFNSRGIAVRSGQHCAKIIGNILGCQTTVRMSTYLYTTKEEIDAFVETIKNGGDILDAYFN